MRAQSEFYVAYNCPHCGVTLEADDDGWDGWRRCPACTRPALPPTIDRRHRLGYAIDLDASPAIEDAADVAGMPHASGSNPPNALETRIATSPVIGPARLIFKTGFILSLALLLIFYLDQQSTYAVIFAALAVIFFLLLLRLPRKRRKRETV